MGKAKKNVTEVVTEPPFTLPEYMTHCPSETCPAHKRFFHPYWRLNEHMKTDHGWPRKSIQAHLDRRKGGKMSQRNGIRKSIDTRPVLKFGPFINAKTDGDSDSSLSSIASSPPHVTQSALWASTKDSSNGSMAGDNTNPSCEREASLSPTFIKKPSYMFSTIMDTTDTPPTPAPSKELSDTDIAPGNADCSDEQMKVLFNEFVATMEHLSSTNGGAETGEKAVRGFKELLANDDIQVNTIMTATKASNLERHYLRLAEYIRQKVPLMPNSTVTQPPSSDSSQPPKPATSKFTKSPSRKPSKADEPTNQSTVATARKSSTKSKSHPSTPREDPTKQKLTLKLNFESTPRS